MNVLKRILLILFIVSECSFAKTTFSVCKIEPPNWWAGMKKKTVQLMVYGKDISGAMVNCQNPGLKVLKIYNVESPNYLFIDLELNDSIKPGIYELVFSKLNRNEIVSYEIAERKKSSFSHQGFDQSDVIYLITPDRFVNGNMSNDIIDGYDQRFGRDDHLARHGGDIEGIISKLDYLNDLGITVLWINPLIENNMFISYHGYSATDFYNIDPRFGTNELYRKLVEEAHKRGIKIILDHVSNHIADNHPWMKDLPEKSWLNGSKEDHLNAVHEKSLIPDLYAASKEREKLLKGWFMDFMPDLNQQNPFLYNYLIQNTIWWIEYTGLDGIREDTYPYSDQNFLADWADAILEEYPHLNIVGEVWDGNPPTLSYFQTNTPLKKDFDSNLPCVTDFNLTYAFGDYLSGRSDLSAIYKALEQDFVYGNPYNLVTFIDNHDILRAAYLSKGINTKLKIALQILLTIRGIPQIYYGTEIGIIGDKDHGDIRADFPGGFPGDKRNAFNKAGRTIEENGLFILLQKMIEMRKSEPALQYGQLKHFPVIDNVYIFKRIYNNEEISIIVNGSEKEKKIDTNYYQFGNSINLKTGDELINSNILVLDPFSVTILKK